MLIMTDQSSCHDKYSKTLIFFFFYTVGECFKWRKTMWAKPLRWSHNQLTCSTGDTPSCALWFASLERGSRVYSTWCDSTNCGGVNDASRFIVQFRPCSLKKAKGISHKSVWVSYGNKILEYIAVDEWISQSCLILPIIRHNYLITRDYESTAFIKY